jgi:hypothetical protein
MKLVSMKLSAEKRDAEVAATPEGDAPAYPWGLALHLEHDQLEKLGIDALPKVGATLAIVAKVKVQTTSTQSSVAGGERRSLSLQITDLAVDTARKASDVLYGK